MDDLKETQGYCQLKEEALDCTVWRIRFLRGLSYMNKKSIEQCAILNSPMNMCIHVKLRAAE